MLNATILDGPDRLGLVMALIAKEPVTFKFGQDHSKGTLKVDITDLTRESTNRFIFAGWTEMDGAMKKVRGHYSPSTQHGHVEDMF